MIREMGYWLIMDGRSNQLSYLGTPEGRIRTYDILFSEKSSKSHLIKCPLRESNSHPNVRSVVSYPLDQEGVMTEKWYKKSFSCSAIKLSPVESGEKDSNLHHVCQIEVSSQIASVILSFRCLRNNRRRDFSRSTNLSYQHPSGY